MQLHTPKFFWVLYGTTCIFIGIVSYLQMGLMSHLGVVTWLFINALFTLRKTRTITLSFRHQKQLILHHQGETRLVQIESAVHTPSFIVVTGQSNWLHQQTWFFFTDTCDVITAKQIRQYFTDGL